MRKWIILILAGFGLVVAGVAVSGGDDPEPGPTPTVTAQATTPAPPAPATPAPTVAEPPEDGETLADDGWEAVSYDLGPDGLGDFEATARILNNTGGDVSGAVFTLTVLDGEAVVATLTGSASEVGAGETATVQFISLDPFVERAVTHTVVFQVDTTF